MGARSAKELEHYQRVREQFEQPDSQPAHDKGKGKATDYSDDSSDDGDDEAPSYSAKSKGKGRAVMLEQDGHEIEFGSNGWEDPAGKDGEELYGE